MINRAELSLTIRELSGWLRVHCKTNLNHNAMDTTHLTKPVDVGDLEKKVKKMYREVALHPEREYHFEMGRSLAEKLGYEPADLDAIPASAIESFAGVGYFHDLAELKDGEKVLDLGSGSGMDSFLAVHKVGRTGKVTGVDMTDEQLEKARRLAAEHNLENITFVKGYIEDIPVEANSMDVVISNGVINLSARKEKVFSEVCRVLKPGGRLVIADIVSEIQLPEKITCDSTLWASCIGGAEQEDAYRAAIEKAGLDVSNVRENSAYHFISIPALGATKKYGVKSISLVAAKKRDNHASR